MAAGAVESIRLKAHKFLEGPLFSSGRAFFPASIDQILMTLAENEMGPEWTADAEVAAWLRPAFQTVFQDTLDANVPAWTREKHLAYLLGMGPYHFHKVPIVLRELLRTRPVASGPVVRVLDVGCGAGVASLSLLHFFELYANALDILDVMGDEGKVFVALSPMDASKEALELYEKVIYSYLPRLSSKMSYDLSAKLHVQIRESTNISEILGEEKYEIILMTHVLSELRELSLDRRAQLAVKLAGHLTDDGVLIFVETSTAGGIQTANQIKSRIVGKGLTLYGPCTHLFGQPSGPICLTCSMSRYEEVLPSRTSQALLSVVGSAGLSDVAGKNIWVHGAFTRDGSIHHPKVDLTKQGILRISDLVKSKRGGRGQFYVQVARRETEPWVHYKVCDQSAKIEECYVAFDAPVNPPLWEVGNLIHLKNARVEIGKRAGGEKLKNAVFLVVDPETQVVDLTAASRSLPVAGLWP
jgi:hypothetical protein